MFASMGHIIMKKKEVLKGKLLTISIATVLPACSLNASIVDLQGSLKETLQSKNSAKEVVPASQQGVVTLSGYRVQSSVNFYRGSSEVITSDGYRVSTSVQSTLFKE